MLKRFTKYVTQSVAGMIGISVYVLADTFFISVYSGADGLAVLNLILPVYGLIYAIGAMIGIGSATRYAISRAKGENTEHYFVQSVTWSILVAVPFMLIGIFIPDKALALLGADAGLIGLGRNYVRIILIATPFFMSNYTFTAFARNDGAPSIAMIGSISGSIFNIIFDYIFIYPMKMGIFGAALATGFSPALSLLILSIFFIKKRNNFKPIKCKFSLKFSLKIMSVGIPSLVTEISSGIVIFVFNIIMLQLLGNIGVAAYGIIANISIVVISIFTGVSQGIQPLISRYYGLNDKKTIKITLKYALITSIIIAIVVYGCLLLFSNPIVSAFNSENNSSLQVAAINGLKIYFTGIFFAGLNIILATYFAATDKAKPAGTISILRGFIVILPLAILLANLFGINGLWISFPLAEFIVSIISFIILSIQRKR